MSRLPRSALMVSALVGSLMVMPVPAMAHDDLLSVVAQALACVTSAAFGSLTRRQPTVWSTATAPR
jgi:hypothetical protein